jgi:PAS domain S-box-containing protein
MIKSWSSLRLHTQLALASGILLAITISITTWLNIQSQRQKLLDNTTNQAISLAKNISIVSSYLVITNKLDELESLLIQSTSFPIISIIKVISEEGETLSHTKKLTSNEIITIYDLLPVKLPEEDVVQTHIDWEFNNLTVWHPIKTSTQLGWIKLDVTLNEVIKLQSQAITDNIISAIIAIFLDLFILLAILYIPAKRFKRVVNFSRNMSNQPGAKMDFSGGSFELDSLIETLNISSLGLEEQNNKIQRQADNLLKLNEEKFRLKSEYEQQEILDSMLESVITIDEHGIINSLNKAGEKLFGYSAKEIVGKSLSVLMPDSDADKHQSHVQRYLSGGKPRIIGIGRELEGKRKNGELFSMRISVSELPKKPDGSRFFIGSCLDLTKQKKQEEQLRRTQKMDALGKLTGGLAHDYNNLLAIIIGYAEILKAKLKNDDELSKYVYEIDHAAERGTKLTNKLLGFSQHNTSKTDVFNINNLLQELQFMLEKTLSAQIKLVFDLAENLWLVELDSGDFEDTIVNMAINAMHAIETSGQIIFQTENEQLNLSDAQQMNLSTGEYVKLNITDTGEGMDEATIEKIFDPFFTSKGEFGTGLGLSQVYGFMQQCGGGIIVNSSPGKGTCFTLYFPRSHQTLTEIQKPKPEVLPEIQGKETLLVVDDEPAMVELAYHILITEGYQVFTAHDAQQALKVLEKEHIDLVISDVIMPNMDGYELATKIQQLYPHIKIQIVTGFADDRQLDTENNKLHKNRLCKPYSPSSLLLRIHELLGHNIKGDD